MLLLLTITALAADPSSEVLQNGMVRGQTSVATTPAQLLGKLADPVWLTGVDGSGTTVIVKERDGDCMTADFSSPSILGQMNYTVKRCMVPDGVVATLISSEDFSRYSTRWTVVPENEGSLLTYDLEVASNLMVPQYFVNGQTRKAVLHTMRSLQTELGNPTE